MARTDKKKHREERKAAAAKKKKSSLLFWLALLAVTVVVIIAVRLFVTPGEIPVWGYKIVKTYPHDAKAYTQGLVYVDGVLYEGTGQYGQSQLRRVTLDTGEVEKSIALHERFFGEGITVLGDRIYQLTWKGRTGFIYDKTTFSKLGQFPYLGEGWGLTHDGTNLIMSDGTNTLRFLDPKTLQEVRRLKVTYGTQPLADLNELEYVNGEILANVFTKEYIARISPRSGNVVGWIDVRGLKTLGGEVANGIAYCKKDGKLFVTGKNWSKLYHIELVEREKK